VRVCGPQPGQIQLGYDLRVHDQHRTGFEQRTRLGQPAPRAQELVLDGVQDLQSPGSAVPHDAAHKIAAVVDVDDGAARASTRRRVQTEADRRVTAHGHEGLRQREAKLAQPCRSAGGEEHHVHR
jgi:hypothetical protein